MTTNDFHISTQSPLALLYGDASILENHHLAIGFAILAEPSHNILSSLNKEEVEYFKKLVTEMVLGRDHKEHRPVLKKYTLQYTVYCIQFWSFFGAYFTIKMYK